MANQTAGNPLTYDSTTGATWSGTKYVREFQWINDAKDIADGDSCVIVVNGVTLTAAIDVDVTANFGVNNAAVWTIGPFNPGIPWSDFTMSTLSHGVVHIWLD